MRKSSVGRRVARKKNLVVVTNVINVNRNNNRNDPVVVAMKTDLVVVVHNLTPFM